MRDDFLVLFTQGVLFDHAAIRSHHDDCFEEGREVGGAIGRTHRNTGLASLLIRAFVLKHEVTQVPDHIIDEIELDTGLVSIRI